MFTKLMSVRDLRPWQLDDVPVRTMTIFWAVTNHYAEGRKRADDEHAASADQRESDEARAAAERRDTGRLARFEARESEALAARTHGEEEHDA